MSRIKLNKSEVSMNDRNSITGSASLHNLTGPRTRFQPVRIKALLSLFESEDDDTEPRDSDDDSDTEGLQALPEDEDDVRDNKTTILPQPKDPNVAQSAEKINCEDVGVSTTKDRSIVNKICHDDKANASEDVGQTDRQISHNSNNFETRSIDVLTSSLRKTSFAAPFKHLDNNRINFTPQASIDPMRNRMYNQGSILSNAKLEGRQENLNDFDNRLKSIEPIRNSAAAETPLKQEAGVGTSQNSSSSRRNIFETPQTKLRGENPHNVAETPAAIFSHWSWNNFFQTPTQNQIILNKKEGAAPQGQIGYQAQDVGLQPHRFCNNENRIVRKPLTEATHFNQGPSINEKRSNNLAEHHNFGKSDSLSKENCPIDSKCDGRVEDAIKIVGSLQESDERNDVPSNSVINLEIGKTLPSTIPKELRDDAIILNEKLAPDRGETRITLPSNSEKILNSRNNSLETESQRNGKSGSMISNCDVPKIDLPPAVKSDSNPPVNLQYSVPAKVGDKKPGQIINVRGTNYQVIGKLGQGMSGEVLRVQEVETGNLRAIKICYLSCMEHENAKGCLEEVSMLNRLRAPCIVNMIASEIKSDVLYVVMEMGDTDLSTLLKSLSREKQLPLTMVLYYWTEMLTAVKHIHDNGVIHSDLKPANFLLVRGRLKLIDFGIASTVNADMTSVVRNSSLGTLNYMSPEAIINVGGSGDSSSDDNQYKINFKSDVWSLGCILYSMVYGQTPFQQIRVHWAKINAITNPHEKIAFPPPETANRPGYTPPPPFLVEVIKRCLQHDRKARPTVDQLLRISYVGCNCPPSSSLPSIPPSILSKIKRSLEEDEWRKLLEALEGRKPIQ